MRSRTLPLAALCLAGAAVAAFAAGPEAFGRLALASGLPRLALPLLADPHARGVALYAAGDYAGADRAFAEAGRKATYDRGLSLAATGRYALAVGYFDGVLFVDPADADARFNRDLVVAKVPGVIGESNSIDGVAADAAANGPSEATTSDRDLIKAKSLAIQLSILDPRVKSFTAATESWLTTLEDEPALYLKRRIKAEYQRRQDLGLANPPEDTAW
ncbi:hypothetical protein [Jiella sonneratiae]|uniref:Ca-activated chloride channel family protein n=1 Tax=Jiella sonneratiae TaxID=2816856 RepID=A0ABS3J4J7_9HYPH|nr:hypothetical protein [Jiella sonneratiae]MBO0904603.1 hypothetical protein [Jiella sonneratiae]